MDGLLCGVRVLDFGIWRPVPYATQLLAELGADVLKVEPPGGDPMRTFPDLFAMLNANKRSIVVDLKDRAARAHVVDLARDADVAIEGFRPGVAGRLGIDRAALAARNPALVYCSLSGYGQDGPLGAAPGHDLNYQAVAGALSPDGRPPELPAVMVADCAGGLAAAMAVLAAYVGRLRTGEGEHVDVSMTDVLATWITPFSGARVGAEPADRLDGLASYGIFRCNDGWATLAVMTEDHFWRAACGVLGLASLADLDLAGRRARRDEVRAALDGAFAPRACREVCAALVAAGAPAAPVLTRAEMLQHAQLLARGTVRAQPWAPVAMGHPALFARRPAVWASPPPALDANAGEGWRPR